MSSTYIYAPFTGEILGKELYCDGSPHPVLNSLGGGCCPIDILGSFAVDVWLYADSSVKSIEIIRVDAGVCRAQNLRGTAWDQGVIVKLYGDFNAQCYIGFVSYGHLADRANPGVYNTNSKRLGSLPNDLCNYPNLCDCGQTSCCSEGIHIHMQCSTNGELTALPACSNQIVYAGSTWIYKFPGVCIE